MPTAAVPTQQPSPDVQEARHHLAHLLRGDLTLDDRLVAGEALSIVSDVVPPYPPWTEPDESDSCPDSSTRCTADLDAHFRAAHHHLQRAVEVAASGAEALRCATAARVLRGRSTRSSTDAPGSAS